MSLNSSKTPASLEQKVSGVPQGAPNNPASVSMKKRILYVIGLPAWVFFGFMLAQALVLALLSALQAAGVSFDSVDASVFNATASGIIYALAITLVIGVPWWIKRRPTTLKDIGAQRPPNWMDLVWAPTGLFVYLVCTTIVMALATQFLTFVDFSQAQDTGFAEVASRPELILAFISLVIIAPVAEEVLFRGYLLGKLRKYAPLWVAILVTSALFAFVHFQWNVAIDVFVLSIVLCLLRVVSGSLWPSILLHMMKNGVAFYFLFINPSLLSTLGG